MLPPELIDKLKRERDERRQELEQPALQIPPSPVNECPAIQHEYEEEQTFNRVVVIDLA